MTPAARLAAAAARLHQPDTAGLPAAVARPLADLLHEQSVIVAACDDGCCLDPRWITLADAVLDAA